MKKIFTFLALVTLLFACNQSGNKKQVKGKDRIVCVSKEQTELMFALNQGDRIVGVDLSSTYPPDTKSITKVGYHRHFSAEGIISLDPTIVIHHNDVVPPEAKPQVTQVGIPIKVCPAAVTLNSTIANSN